MTIVAATDLSENSRTALRYAQRLATVLGEQLLIVNVVELWARDMSRILQTFEEADLEPSEQAIDEMEAFVTETLGFDHGAQTKVLVGHPPVERLLEEATKANADLIVAGTSGHSKLSEAFFGSTISALARQSRMPVLAVPPGMDDVEIKAILAPVDFSTCSEHSLALAGKLARGFDARLFVLHAAPFGVPSVAPPIAYIPESATEVRKAAKNRAELMVEEVGLGQDTEILVDLAPPHQAIHEAIAEHGIDLVVMGTHGRKGVSKFFLGSTAERVLRDRPCPVIILRETPED